MQLQEIDEFFTNHPLKEQYFKVSEAERSGCTAVAERDVLAAVANCPLTGEKDQEFIQAAIAEQTIFLLLNPEYLTGAYTRVDSLSSAGTSRRFNGQDSPLGQRAAALLAPLTAGQKTSGDASLSTIGSLRLNRG